jgi:hypothetical protein
LSTGHKTAPSLERLAESGLGIDGLGHRVDVREADLMSFAPNGTWPIEFGMGINVGDIIKDERPRVAFRAR